LDEVTVSPFTFYPMGEAGSGVGGEVNDVSPDSDFVPMWHFDTSEVADADTVPVTVPEELPEVVELPGVAMTEEELDRQLREAFNSGLQEGKNLAERGLVNVFRSLRSAAEGVQSLREKVLRESEDELIRLITMVARKVILREMAQDRSILLNVIQAAISGLSERDEITVRLNPDDHALVTSGHEDYFRRELMNDRMHLKADPTVLPGNCQIDAEFGTIDASIDAQLEEIYRCLLEERSMSSETGN
jgi:flagellar assembly protein FliH